MYAPQKYALVKVGRRRHVAIEIIKEGPRVVTGFRVNEDGSRWYKVKGNTETSELVVAAPSEIVQRMRLNLHYCDLEVDDRYDPRDSDAMGPMC